jgi:hypothetical protein
MKRYQPALLGGLAIGILSSLPVISLANCCCLWVIGGGMLTVYLQQQNLTEPIETGEAVIGGLIAGVVGAIIVCIVGYLKLMLLHDVVNGVADRVRQQLDSNPDVPPQVRDMVIKLVSGGGMALMALIQVPIYAIFSMLGSLLGLAFFRKKVPTTPVQ